MFDVSHRDVMGSLSAARDAGGADLVLTSPPYPDARSVDQYGASSFDTSLRGYRELGRAILDALKVGGVCALNLDGPVRIWRPDLGESERSLITYKVAIDWAETIGFRYVERCIYGRNGTPGSHGPRWRSGGELVHVFARPGGPPYFAPDACTRRALWAGNKGGGRNRAKEGWRKGSSHTQGERRQLTTNEHWTVNQTTTDRDHPAPFSSQLADAFVLCYCPPDGLVCDPFVGSGTVAFACHRHRRRFVGGDLGHRERDGRRWADIVNDSLSQETFEFEQNGELR